MKKRLIDKESGLIVTIVMIKKGDFEYDFDKLVDTMGREWLPERLSSADTSNDSIFNSREEIHAYFL